MIVTTYTCDKCGHSQERPGSPKQLWDVGIGIEVVGSSRSYSTSPPLFHAKIWCRDCVTKAGLLLPSRTDEEKAPTPPPTLEDMIRELIKEEIDDSR